MRVVTPIDRCLRWTTAVVCGYETITIIGKALDEEFPFPTITFLTYSNRHRRATYIAAGAVLGLLLHHLLVEGLDMGVDRGTS